MVWILLVAVCVALTAVSLTLRWQRKNRAQALARHRIEKKRQSVSAAKQKLRDQLCVDGFLLTEERQRIVQLDILELTRQLQTGQLKCLQVMHAYQAKALQVTADLNCVTEFITQADEWARKLDEQDVKAPLHGLPFSVKDNINVAGYDSSMGLSKNLDLPVVEDCALVATLKALGAIPFCKTNVSQMMSSPGATNPVWGRTKNPHSKERTPGGSSGGEGSLIGAGGSPFGLGSDNAGSARFPAACCGIASLKPTIQRLSTKGFRKGSKCAVGGDSVPGIMGRDADTVAFVAAALLKRMAEFDPDVLPIPWNEQMFRPERTLRIGYYDGDGYFPTTPGVRRCVAEAVSLLEALGHELIPFQPPHVAKVLSSLLSFGYADGGRFLLKSLSDEIVDPSLNASHIIGLKLPLSLKRLLAPLIARIDPRLVPVFLAIGKNRLSESYQLWEAVEQQNEYRSEFTDLWRRSKLDVCISPAFAMPAPLEGDVGSLMVGGSSLALYNFINHPTGVVPITIENGLDQSLLEHYPTDTVLTRLAKETTRGAIGMPLCVQVIGQPWNEELVLNVMKTLQSAIRKSSSCKIEK